MAGRRALRGHTLVDVLAGGAVAAVLAAAALPSYRAQLVKARRADAVVALTRLQAAQERMRAQHGLYSTDLAALRVAAQSEAGYYTLAVELKGGDGYRATATAVAGQSQGGDGECASLVVDVVSSFPTVGPSARCWNR